MPGEKGTQHWVQETYRVTKVVLQHFAADEEAFVDDLLHSLTRQQIISKTLDYVETVSRSQHPPLAEPRRRRTKSRWSSP